MKRLIIVAHAVLVIFAYSSPFWLDWRLVVVGIVVYWMQIIIFKSCVLSHAQFNDHETTFHEWYLSKLGLNPPKHILKNALNIWIPLILILAAFLLQYFNHINPLISF